MKVRVKRTKSNRIVSGGSVFPILTGGEKYGSTYKQKWEVEEAVSASGRRRTLVNQDAPQGIFELKYTLNKAERDALVGFYAQQKGQAGSFWYKDFDMHHVTNQALPMIASNKFQCVSVVGGYAESAVKVENIVVYVNRVATTDFTETNGVVSVVAAEGEVTATYDYYIKVAFNAELSIKDVFDDVYEVSVKLKVVRE